MREQDVARLKTKYTEVVTGPEEGRLGPALGVDLISVTQLGDTLVADLDAEVHGIEWWQAYANLDLQKRIFISDHLVACARGIPQNLLEAEAYYLELNHAIDDFRVWLERGVSAKGFKIPPPRGPYDDLANYRVAAHLVGIFRALASALDCLAGCLVGVAALPTGIVHTDIRKAKEKLKKVAEQESRLASLNSSLEQFEADSGPGGWLDWLLAMRNMLVHRGRRLLGWNITRGDNGHVDDFVLYLPRSPELTEVEAWIHAGGYVATQFHVSHDEFLRALTRSVHTYVSSVAIALTDFWGERKDSPSLLEQPASQWKDPQTLIQPPLFSGYSNSPATSLPVTEVGTSDEIHRRLKAAGLTKLGRNDVEPSPAVWFQGKPS